MLSGDDVNAHTVSSQNVENFCVFQCTLTSDSAHVRQNSKK